MDLTALPSLLHAIGALTPTAVAMIAAMAFGVAWWNASRAALTAAHGLAETVRAVESVSGALARTIESTARVEARLEALDRRIETTDERNSRRLSEVEAVIKGCPGAEHRRRHLDTGESA